MDWFFLKNQLICILFYCVILSEDLKTVARVVVGVELSDGLLQFIISMFDEDGESTHNDHDDGLTFNT